MSIKLKPQKWRGWVTYTNQNAGVAPYFSAAIRGRVNSKKATNVVITGEPGTGKSYLATDIVRVLEGLTASGNDRFKLSQLVFTFKQYMGLILKLKMGKAIVFDEPSYAMGKRDWYKDLNKALVQTVESQRFKVHPLFIPIINKALLDKTIRSYLIQYQVHVIDRGRAIVYRIYPSQHSEKIYRYFICMLNYHLFDHHLCERDSCLDCPKLTASPLCMIMRAQYERKKAATQEVRYEQALDMATIKESQTLSDDQVERMLYGIRERFTNTEGEIDVQMLRIVARRTLGVRMGDNKALRMKKLLKHDYPQDFPS